MKVSMEKNLVFGDQPAPFLFSDLPTKMKDRKAVKPLPSVQLDQLRILPTDGKPKISFTVDEKGNAVEKISNFKIGVHAFPTDIEAKPIPSLGAKSRTFAKPLVTETFIPEHLDLKTSPEALAPKLRTAPFIAASLKLPTERKYGNPATTVFAPDQRAVLSSTSYPWSAIGKVDSPLGYGTGVMVGPRHLLTVSHVIQWLPNNTCGWVRFRPAYFAPSAPFGDAWATRVYYKQKVSGPTIDWVEGMYDYVVCVLDRNIGNWTGWLGSKGYTDSWDGGAYWTHVGYPGDLTGGNRPTVQSGISLDGVWWEPDSHESMSHYGDVWPGQSGGPFFGWWSAGPYAVAVQSSHNSSQNNASGGQDMVDLVIRARAEYP